MALMAGDERIADVLRAADAVLLSPVVIGELHDGFLGGTWNARNREILEAFRQKPRTITVPILDETADWFAEIKRMLRRKGKPIPINDVWIAASCLEHGARLVSLDTHFSHVEGLLRWTS
jgi:tRNA(fMet)-specific endonuclease VapC